MIIWGGIYISFGISSDILIVFSVCLGVMNLIGDLCEGVSLISLTTKLSVASAVF